MIRKGLVFEMLVRKLVKEDVFALSELEKDNFSIPWSEKTFLEAIESKDYNYYVVEENGIIIGGCGVHNILGEGDITNVVIHKSYRGQGIAFKMLSVLLEESIKLGIHSFALEVRESNEAAIHLYHKLGFQKEGIRKNFYELPPENAIIMWKR